MEKTRESDGDEMRYIIMNESEREKVREERKS